MRRDGFTPDELFEITDISPELQRDWRRRGYLPTNKDGRHARYTWNQVIEFALLREFSRWIGPKHAVPIVAAALPSALRADSKSQTFVWAEDTGYTVEDLQAFVEKQRFPCFFSLNLTHFVARLEERRHNMRARTDRVIVDLYED